jgi:Uma2 family endonuclease
MAVDVERHRFSIEQYERMVEVGVLTEDDRVELIDGEIVEMAPIDPDHSFPVQRLARVFMESLGGRAYVRIQDAIRLPPQSEPEPDVVLARPPDDLYRRRHPGPDDLFLVVEVAHTTQIKDRRMKIPLYAQQGILEAWLLDVPAQQLEIYRQPSPDGYRSVEFVGRGGPVAPLAFPDLLVVIDDVLP